MAVARPASSEPIVTRADRPPREEEVLVWPDLVFIEFIAVVVFTILITILSVLVNALLLDQADPSTTPNPAKAPWYFMSLQEMLLHMNPALAGVIVPTVALLLLAATPYIDRSNEGQGQWWGTPRSKLIVLYMVIISPIITVTLILLDASKHVQLYQIITGKTWPTKLNWLQDLRAFETNINWPGWSTHVPLGDVLRTDLIGLPRVNLNLNLPAILDQQIIPVCVLVGFPALLSFIAWKIKLCRTRRDFAILLFTGFITVYFTMTIVATFFRGHSQTLVPYSIFSGG